MNHSGTHYDEVTNLFETILGENLHVGLYEEPGSDLHDASTALTRLMIEQVNPREGCRVLDVGCGVGGPARYLAERHGATVVGLSNSAECIERAAKIPHSRVSYLCMDALELANSSLTDFDIAWLLESSHLMEDKNLLFKGLHHVTGEAGRFVLCDFFLSDEKFAENRRNILKMRKIYKVFGRLHLTSPNFYQKKAVDNGFLKTNSIDITEKTYPTLDIWLKEAENQLGELPGRKDFIDGVKFLQELYQNHIVSYHVISGEKV